MKLQARLLYLVLLAAPGCHQEKKPAVSASCFRFADGMPLQGAMVFISGAHGHSLDLLSKICPRQELPITLTDIDENRLFNLIGKTDSAVIDIRGKVRRFDIYKPNLEMDTGAQFQVEPGIDAHAIVENLIDLNEKQP